MGKIVFDLDNTLYSFAETGIAKVMGERITTFTHTKLGITPDEANKLTSHYYATYGLTARGIKLHHPEIDIEEYLEYVHHLPECTVKADPELEAMLSELQARGWELWVMTNGCVRHAHRILSSLGIRDLFADRIFDCRDQWQLTTPDFHNKPETSAFAGFEERIRSSADEPFIMVEDSMANLHGPAALNWGTVWISHGSDVPSTAPQGVIVIQNVRQLLAALDEASG